MSRRLQQESGQSIDAEAVVTRVSIWLRERPHVVVGIGILIGTTLGYWSKRR